MKIDIILRIHFILILIDPPGFPERPDYTVRNVVRIHRGVPNDYTPGLKLNISVNKLGFKNMGYLPRVHTLDCLASRSCWRLIKKPWRACLVDV